MPQDFEDVVSPWTAASPFGLNALERPSTEEIDAVSQIGAKWLRTQYAPWAVAEQQRGVYRFTPDLDRFVEAWHDADIQALAVLGYGNPLYSGRDDEIVAPCTPEQIQAYASYVHATVEHYRRWTKHWEIWNEPNRRGFWKPNPFPDAYLALLKAAYPAAKSADPDCVVVGGALFGTDLAFLERLLSLGGARHMDALSIHPRSEASGGPKAYLEELQTVRELVNRYRADLPIWITETGAPTTSSGGGHLPPGGQALDLVRTYVLSLAAGVERIFWGHSPDREVLGPLGMDPAEVPARAAYSTMTRVLEGAECVGRVAAPDGVWAIAFRKHNQDLLVCWSPGQVTEVDLLGDAIRRWNATGLASREADGPIRLALGPPPLYAVGHSLVVVAE